jgi:hypothetical protein
MFPNKGEACVMHETKDVTLRRETIVPTDTPGLRIP